MGLIEPPPPLAEVTLPWDGGTVDPTEALTAARARNGDVFGVVSGSSTYFFVFSPLGLQNFYAVAEEQASKGLADWLMLRRKVPDELFAGRRTLPHELFGRPSVSGHLVQFDAALDESLRELGPAGHVDAFAFARRLGHRAGLYSWGPGASLGPAEFEILVAALDVLDPADAFVHPEAMAGVGRTDKAAERAAMARCESVLMRAGRGWASSADHHPYAAVRAAWAGDPGEELGIARDVILVHLASMSNLFSALGWAIVNVARHGTHPSLGACALESIRIAQRSIMMRAVLKRLKFVTEDQSWLVQPGVTLATHLPVLNTTAAPDMDRYEPTRYAEGRLATPTRCREEVTTFGHGPHACPARPFSMAVIERTLAALFEAFAVGSSGPVVQPLPGQIGGVARPDGPAMLSYRRR